MKRLEKRDLPRSRSHNYSQTAINFLADNGEVDLMNMIEYSNLMEESNIYNIEYFMGKNAVYLVDKIEGRVGSFVIASGNVIIKDYSEYGGIYKFVTGPLSSSQVVLTKDGRIFEDGQEIRFASVIDQRPTINKVACNGRGSILASTHDLYARGSDNVFHVFSQKFNELGNNISKTEFVPIGTFEHEIIDIQCGYFHTVVLLANGELHACGYNCLHQSSWDSSTQELGSFKKIEYSFGTIQKFGCTSRGTWVIDGKFTC